MFNFSSANDWNFQSKKLAFGKELKQAGCCIMYKSLIDSLSTNPLNYKLDWSFDIYRIDQ